MHTPELSPDASVHTYELAPLAVPGLGTGA
jgi:hypothetical protein